MTDSTETTPQAFGELTEDERRVLETIRRDHDNITREIGIVEIRKARLVVVIGELENRAQETLLGVAKRLNIPEGQMWHVDPRDGKAWPGQGRG